MAFIGIMLLSTLDPTPGHELNYLFRNPKKYPYTQAMTFTSSTSTEYIEKTLVEIILDESSAACCSKYGHALIFYNPTKPTDGYNPDAGEKNDDVGIERVIEDDSDNEDEDDFGRTISMDNYYGSADTLINLQQNGVYGRRTSCQNQKIFANLSK
eukprot:15364653-Ditylum_brightwellii.AAC.1